MTHKTEDPSTARSGDYLDGFLASAFRPAEIDRTAASPNRVPVRELPVELAGYRVEESIGRGGVGDVYRVADPELGRELAIKILRREHANDTELVRRFRDEARLCGQLTHPGIVEVHEMGSLQDRRPYFTMRLVEGETFANILRRRADPTQDRHECLKILTRMCQTLAYVHAKDVMHGDIKPHNVMVGAFGEVQLMDWGFAHHRKAAAHLPETATLRVGGTPAYMAPEQTGPSSSLTLATDVFCIGAILCEILTGRPPYAGASKNEVIDLAAQARLEDAHERLESCGAERSLVDLAHACLRQRPEDRPPDAGAVAQRLNSYFDHIEDHAREMEFQAAAARASLEQTRRARRLGFALMACFAGGVFLVSGMVLWNASEREARRTQISEAVADAMRRTARLRAWAQISPSLEAWTKALSAAHEAAALAATHDSDPRLLNRANAVLGEIETERQHIARKQQLLDRLAAIMPHVDVEHPARQLDTMYTSLFADAGIDILAGATPENISAIRDFLPAPILVSALDTWSQVRRKYNVPDSDAWNVPHKIVKEIDTDPWRNVVRDAFGRKDDEKLKQLAKQKIDKSSAASLRFLAQCLKELGHVDDARNVLRRAHGEYPSDPRINHDLAVLADPTKPSELSEALRLLSMAVAVRPEDAHLWTDLSLYRIQAHQTESALHSLEHAKHLDPQSPRAWFLTGVAWNAIGEPADAKVALRKAMTFGNLDAGVILGVTLSREGRLEAALEPLERVREQRPDDFCAVLQLGVIRSRFYQLETGIALLQKAVELDAKSVEAHGRLGLALLRAGRWDAAIDSLQRAERLSRRLGTSTQAQLWLGHGRDYLDAAFRYSHLDGADPAPEDLALFASAAWRSGDSEAAVHLYEAALASDDVELPCTDFVHSEAAFAAADHGADGKRSLEILTNELEVFENQADGNDLDPSRVRETLCVWRNAPYLQRFKHAEEWSDFWHRVGSLLVELDSRE